MNKTKNILIGLGLTAIAATAALTGNYYWTTEEVRVVSFGQIENAQDVKNTIDGWILEGESSDYQELYDEYAKVKIEATAQGYYTWEEMQETIAVMNTKLYEIRENCGTDSRCEIKRIKK